MSMPPGSNTIRRNALSLLCSSCAYCALRKLKLTQRDSMSDDRYNRWQSLAMAQMSVALISGLSVSALALGLSLLQNETFTPRSPFKLLFAWSFPFLLLAAIFCTAAVVSRLIDFRLTARKVRKIQKPNYTRPLTMFRLGPDAYGRLTWALFWAACVLFIVGVSLLFVSIGSAYAYRF